ncbi:hypothetical protein KO566_07505 [Flavobacteriaceae bacterium XHP0103]|uniref:hypothetical protein n=1 Tax=Marixanthotalea marina TaxID=2844359 RepID=UPI002989DED5|nr:hypothetical protein [Marixanthotalea marina]MBU3821904.1 hypothetical protein [Marixanthotalea marina]
MKNTFFIFLAILFVSCKESKSNDISEQAKELTIAEKIANAHGYESWENVREIEFTFNVDRGENHSERSWTWEPKNDIVTFLTQEDSNIVYNRKSMDSTDIKTDRSFINDKFWLFIPFQLVWDQGTTISEPIMAEAPISKTNMHKITLTYPNEGGYTPGDAYDLFYGDDFLIKEWVYRRDNSETPSLTTTLEDYQDFNGLKLATMRKMANNNDWSLFFTNIKVTTE